MGFSKLLRKIATGTSEQHCELKLLEAHQKNCSRQERQRRNKNKETRRVDLMPGVYSIDVIHHGKTLEIKRQQDPDATINPRFAKISRPCPPFCIQPMQLAPGIETIGEIEMLAYLQQAGKDDSILVIDSRITQWVEKGTIPGSIHIPWTSLARTQGATTKAIVHILREHFGMELIEGKNCADVSKALAKNAPEKVFNFQNAKTLVLFCNGNWCAQTPNTIEALLSFGYPPEKLKYYRDGMQGWESLGLTTVVDKPKNNNKRATSCDNWFVSIEK